MKTLPALFAALLSWTAMAAYAIDDMEPEETAADAAIYRVEVLVFANSNPVDEASELWLPPRKLPVPASIRALTPASEPTAAGNDTTTSEPQPPVAAGPLLFTELKPYSPEFEQAADRMQRSRYYRVLAMTAWNQPIPRDATPVAIVIRGGEVFGQHHELEGSISVRRERYLHAHARLWLSRFTDYTGETETTEEDWPSLPLLPQPPKAEPPAIEPTDVSTETSTSNDVMPAGMLTNDTASADEPTGDTDTGAMPADDELDDNWSDLDWFAPARPDRIALLDQSRKMRSGELHYIDHPLFGVIVRVTPVDSGASSRR